MKHWLPCLQRPTGFLKSCTFPEREGAGLTNHTVLSDYATVPRIANIPQVGSQPPPHVSDLSVLSEASRGFRIPGRQQAISLWFIFARGPR